MIRRSTVDGGDWLLIQQLDHARLSAELAENWRTLDGFEGPDDRSDLLQAIRHHDDGWSEWDSQLKFSAETGVPIAFYEMPPGADNAIWERSIRGVEPMGPLPAYIVAGHFLRMRRASKSADPTGSNQDFIDRFASECERWLRQWAAQRGEQHPNRRLAEQAVDQLQFFDSLSLVICVGQVHAPLQLSQPAGRQVSVVQESTWEYSISPHLMRSDRFESTVRALQLPAEKYTSDKQLKRAAVQRDLIWTVRSNE